MEILSFASLSEEGPLGSGGISRGFLNGMAFLDVPEIRPPTLCYSLHALDPTVLILPLGKLLL